MSRSNFLLVLAGLPASGKSTFARKFKEVVESQNIFQIKIIDPDLIRNQLYPDSFNLRKENEIKRQAISEIRMALKQNYIVISDDLNYYTSMRHDLKYVAEDLKKSFFIIYISTPLEKCLQWNEARGKLIPNQVIIDVYNKFDRFNQYNWDNPLSELDLSKVQDLELEINKILKRIEANLKLKQEASKSKNREAVDNSEFNKEIDKITRKIVGDILQKNYHHPKKKLILNLRKEFIKAYTNTKLNASEVPELFIKFLKERLSLKD